MGSSALRFVTHPGLLRAERGDGSFSLYHPGHGTSLDVEEQSAELVSALLEAFAEPVSLADFARKNPDFPEELVAYVLRALFVVPEQELAFLEHGFLRPPSSPVCAAWSWSDLPELAAPGMFVLTGVPVDMAAGGTGGARHGPREIRKLLQGPLLSGEGEILDHDFSRRYVSFVPRLADLGDIDSDGARLDHVGARLAKVVREVLALGMRPLILGGDHSITHYVLREIGEHVPRFGIIHFDAHADLGPGSTVSHANVFSEVIESSRVVSLLQIGLRGLEHVSPFARRVACPKRSIVSSRAAQQGGALRALEGLPKDIPYYLSFDIDCIDAAVARETGTPLYGGMSFELALELVDHIARNLQLLGADFVEVCAGQGPGNAAASMAAALIQRVLLGEHEFTALGSDVYTFKP